MSLFFEDEIQKVKRKMDKAGLEKLRSQDPRNNRNWANRHPNISFIQTLSRRDQYDSRNRPDSW